jgi:hypothetical protein
VKATNAATEARQFETADLLMFQGWLSAAAQREPVLQAFYRQRFRPEFASAFEAWLLTAPLTNPAAPAGPFAMPDYHSARLAEARQLQKQADDLFEQGQKDNEISDHFVRATVLLAVALFFGGIAQTFRSATIKGVLVGLAFVVCVISALQVAHLPLLSLNSNL